MFKAFGGLQLDELRFPFDEVTVVLGDPTKPAYDKLNQKWNAEDLETREKLMAALDRIPRVKFTYLSNHDTLYDDLRRTQPRFVLNFCDEGLNNRADLELHIPAMCESLGIPCKYYIVGDLILCNIDFFCLVSQTTTMLTNNNPIVIIIIINNGSLSSTKSILF